MGGDIVITRNIGVSEMGKRREKCQEIGVTSGLCGEMQGVVVAGERW